MFYLYVLPFVVIAQTFCSVCASAFTEDQLTRILLNSFSAKPVETNINAVNISLYQSVKVVDSLVEQEPFSEHSQRRFQSGDDVQTRVTLLHLLYRFNPETVSHVKVNKEILVDSKAAGVGGGQGETVLNRLVPANTLAGEVVRMLVLAKWPTSDLQTIHERQQIIRQVLLQKPDYLKLSEKLAALRRDEPKVAELFDHSSLYNSRPIQEKIYWYEDPGVVGSALLSEWYNTGLSFLQSFVTYSGYYSVLYAGMGYGLCSRSNCFRWGIVGAELMMIYLERLIVMKLNEYLQLKDKETCRVLKVYLDALYRYLRQLSDIQAEEDFPDVLRISITEVELSQLTKFEQQIGEWLRAGGKNLDRALYLATVLSGMKDTLAKVIYDVGKMDLFLAVAARMHTTLNSDPLDINTNRLTFAHFNEQGVYLEMEGFWNPWLDGDLAVTNNLQLGDSGNGCVSTVETSHAPTEPVCGRIGRKMLLSGNNASGKSTLMRAVTLNAVFLAQTLGIATARSYDASLFYAANSYMDKYDKAGNSSSYMEELRYLSELFEDTDDLKGKPRLVLIDELFSTTDPDDGKKGLELVLNALSERDDLIALITTHYNTTTFGVLNDFAVKHMAMLNQSGKLKPSYRLAEGGNNNTAALDLLAERFQSELPRVASKIRAYQSGKL